MHSNEWFRAMRPISLPFSITDHSPIWRLSRFCSPKDGTPVPLLYGGMRSHPTLGSDVYTPEAIEAVEVPGDHFSMLYTPHAAELAAKLQAYIDVQEARNEGV
jgi:thioesterase domain-containing protein